MKILTYQNIYNDNTHKYINLDIVEKLLYNNINYFYSKNNNIAYYLLVIPSLNINNITNTYNDAYRLIEKEISFSNIKFNIPSYVLDKIVLIYNYKIEKFIIIKSDYYNTIDSNNIYNFIISYTNELQKLFNIINNITMKINYELINVEYHNINTITRYIDKLLIYLHYCSNFLQQIINITDLLNKSHEYYNIINKNIQNLINISDKIKGDLQNIRQTTFQRVTYIETGTSRMLTGIATIFLPLSFVIAFFSLPFKNVPLQNNNYGVHLVIIIIILILLSFYKTNILKYITSYFNNLNFK